MPAESWASLCERTRPHSSREVKNQPKNLAEDQGRVMEKGKKPRAKVTCRTSKAHVLFSALSEATESWSSLNLKPLRFRSSKPSVILVTFDKIFYLYTPQVTICMTWTLCWFYNTRCTLNHILWYHIHYHSKYLKHAHLKKGNIYLDLSCRGFSLWMVDPLVWGLAVAICYFMV